MLSGVQSLDNERRVRILGIIDKLRELGVSENVSLPSPNPSLTAVQLVVVGDQSSGKSSLLEGLTGLSFPIDSDLCTRFATQIVLRRVPANDAEVKVTIIPGPTAQADDELKARLQSFERTLAVDSFGPAEFKEIFDEAAENMGLPGANTKELENLEKRFSDDILKIELSGPNQQHLSIVDVPGLFHNPLGARTVGIITKFDTVQQGDEEGVLRIARNEIEKLRHGWFAVKNRSTKDIREGVTIEQRHTNEKTFFASNAPWNELHKDRVGIDKVRGFLGNLLYDHIRGEFPSMVKEIEDLARQTKTEIELLGPARQSPTDQRRFLMHIASKYQAEVTKASTGNYTQGLPPRSVLKLRLRVRQLNEEFADEMNRNGHAKAFQTVNNKVDEEYFRSSDDDESIYDWIRALYRDSRGVELPGTVNPAVLESMFREQSAPWGRIASTYLEKAIRAVKEFNDQIFDSLISEDELRRRLRSRLNGRQSLALEHARKHLGEILTDEREGILQTVNHYLAETLSSIREERVKTKLESLDIQNSWNINISHAVTQLHLSNEDQAVYDIHDILKAYYKVALKRFCDNIIVQVTERHLLGPQGPVKILSPEFIGELSDGELADIASESFATSSLRIELQTRADRLRKALELANQTGV
ncbi:P-loop containing nucleoside triphosphate hydrolase protein [Aspergillus steynii IBT 23096]|uniref:P-loop containing nucleoside triphosphate hydrolase protein n=1 Tax=Aspergillus steynii IBT 23096 TaxID=1392250 RepID=A0A2I2G090_9EURO|nr:P-loop containing nucleoside triphosphate hydrolase protein [Aspergillus steynii IBT 23096]PLB46308.1 P-loop containing nucleoside triphosphate hydrolase protein [Aspergillus steynii IBT 23096]